MSNIAIILAGGRGSRVGLEYPKQFAFVCGKPVIQYTIEIFENHPEIDSIEIVIRKGYEKHIKTIIKNAKYAKVKNIVTGGTTFQESVENGIKGLNGTAKENDLILIHYGASPFTSNEIISDAIRVAKKYGNASPAKSSIYLTAARDAFSDDDSLSSTRFINRDDVIQLNTPFVIKYDDALRVYKEGHKTGVIDGCDEHTTSLMLALGERLWFSRDETSNIKITTKEDLQLFKGWLLAKETK